MVPFCGIKFQRSGQKLSFQPNCRQGQQERQAQHRAKAIHGYEKYWVKVNYSNGISKSVRAESGAKV